MKNIYLFALFIAGLLLLSSSVSLVSAANYSVGFHVRDADDVLINTGWNLVALTLERNSTGDDRNITLHRGWNLIGYSSPNATEHATLKFTGSPEENWTDAVANGRVQKYLAYSDPTDTTKRYQYAGFNTPNLTQDLGYWVYVNENTTGTMTIPDAGGSHIGDSYRVTDVMFTNCTNTTDLMPGYNAREGGCSLLNVNDAVFVGQWIINRVDYYNTTSGALLSFPIIGSSRQIDSWQGYSFTSRRPNITLLRMN